jgi:hypothetical protein
MTAKTCQTCLGSGKKAYEPDLAPNEATTANLKYLPCPDCQPSEDGQGDVLDAIHLSTVISEAQERAIFPSISKALKAAELRGAERVEMVVREATDCGDCDCARNKLMAAEREVTLIRGGK